MPPRVGRGGGGGGGGGVDDVGVAQMRALIDVRPPFPGPPTSPCGVPSPSPLVRSDAPVGTPRPIAQAHLRDGDAERENLRAFHAAWSSAHDGFRVVVAAQERALRALHADQLARLRDLLRRARDAPAPITPDLLARRWAQRVALARGELAVAAYLDDAANAREAAETRAHLHRVDRDNAARLADDHRRRVDETVALSSAAANVEAKLLRWRANIAEGLRVAARTAPPRVRTRTRTRTDARRDPTTTTTRTTTTRTVTSVGTRRDGDVVDVTRGKLASATDATFARVADAEREATAACGVIVARSKEAAARSTRATRAFLSEARERASASRGGVVDWSDDPRGVRGEPPLDILEANGVDRVARALDAARVAVEGGEGFQGDESERAAAAAEAERRRRSGRRRETRGGLLVMEEDEEDDEGGEGRGVAPEDGFPGGDGDGDESRDGASRDERRRVSSSRASAAADSAASRRRRRDHLRSAVDWVEDEDEERGDLRESFRAELGTGTWWMVGMGTRCSWCKARRW
jgi:hypothetical protein